MDMIYQTIKNLLKAIVNLFVAMIELFTGLINWLASLFLRISPSASGVKDEASDKSVKEKVINSRFIRMKSAEPSETIVQMVRDELKESITSRDQYILAKAGAEVFESSRIRGAFAGRRKRLVNAITRELLETEFKDSFPVESKEAEVKSEDTRIQAICEVGKEAIG